MRLTKLTLILVVLVLFSSFVIAEQMCISWHDPAGKEYAPGTKVCKDITQTIEVKMPADTRSGLGFGSDENYYVNLTLQDPAHVAENNLSKSSPEDTKSLKIDLGVDVCGQSDLDESKISCKKCSYTWQSDTNENNCCGDDGNLMRYDFIGNDNCEQSTDDGHIGGNAYKLKLKSGSECTSQNTGYIKINKNKKYTLSLWAKSKNNNKAYFNVVFYDKNFNQVSILSTGVAGKNVQVPTQWKFYSGTFKPQDYTQQGKPDPEYAKIVFENKGTLWYDDIIFTMDEGYMEKDKTYACLKQNNKWNWTAASKSGYVYKIDSGQFDIVANGTTWIACDARNDGSGIFTAAQGKSIKNGESISITLGSGTTHDFLCFNNNGYEQFAECVGNGDSDTGGTSNVFNKTGNSIKIGNTVYFCTDFFEWTTDLDYGGRATCTGAGQEWTGLLCCGGADDGNEYYNDEWKSDSYNYLNVDSGGCWYGKKINSSHLVSEENLIKNPSFEDTAGMTQSGQNQILYVGVPPNWDNSWYNTPAGHFKIIPGGIDKNTLKIQNTDQSIILLSDPIAIDPTKQYIQSGFVKGEDAKIYYGRQWLKEDMSAINNNYIPSANGIAPIDWKYIEQILNPPSNAAYVRIMLENTAKNKPAYFDNLSLKIGPLNRIMNYNGSFYGCAMTDTPESYVPGYDDTTKTGDNDLVKDKNYCSVKGDWYCSYDKKWKNDDSGGAASNERNTQKQATNLIKNSGFEDGLNNWKTTKLAGTENYTVVQNVNHSGKKSAKMTSFNNRNSYFFQDIEVKKNTNYVFSGWIKTQGIDGATGIGVWKTNWGGFNSKGFSTGGSHDWTRFEIPFNSGNNNNNLRFACYAGSATNGILYCDDLQLEESQEPTPYFDAKQPRSCCPSDYCWNGTGCINQSKYRNNPKKPPLVKDSTGKGYRCINGNWYLSKLKFDWNHNESGWCPDNSQCLTPGLGCINDTVFIADHYCENGNWTSRTKFIVEKLMKFAQNINEYEIFCDTYENTLNNYYSDFSPHDMENFLNENATNICVLSYGNQNDNKVVFGTSLNVPLDGSDFLKAISNKQKCTAANAYTSTGKYDYKDCLGNKTLWYNNKTNSIIFGYTGYAPKQGITLEGEGLRKLIDNLKNFIRRVFFIKVRKNIEQLNIGFVNETADFNYIYLNQRTDNKTITAIMESKYEADTNKMRTFLTVNFENYEIPEFDVCIIANESHQRDQSIGHFGCKRIIIDSNNWEYQIAMKHSDRIKWWNDLTAKLRVPKS